MNVLLHMCCGPCSVAVIEQLLEQGHAVTGFFFNPNIQPLAEYLRRREGAKQAAEHYDIPIILGDSLPLEEQRWDLADTTRAASRGGADSVVTQIASAPAGFVVDTASNGGQEGLGQNNREDNGSGQGSRQQVGEGQNGKERHNGTQKSEECGPCRKNAVSDAEKTGMQSAGQNVMLPPAVDPVPWLRMIYGREHVRCPLCWALRLRQTALHAARKGFDAITSSLLYSRYQNHALITKQANHFAKKQGLAFVYADYRELWQYGIERSKELQMYRQPYCGCMLSEYERYAKKLGKAIATTKRDSKE